MIKNGFTRAYATSLQKVIAANTSNRFKAFFAGLGVTAILQSSTATTMICASFASKNMIGTTAGLAVVIGADVGTTLVAQVLTFDLSWITPLFLLSGAIMHHYYEHKGRKKHIARALIGLGLVLLSLAMIKESAAPLGDSDILPIILKPLESEPLLALLVTAGLTWILHSSLATVLIIASFTSSGLISLKLGLLLVLGANLGAAIIPYMMTYSMDARAKRITTGNLIMRVSMVLAMLPLLGTFMTFFDDLSVAKDREMIHFHTLFNAMLALIFLPIVDYLASFCKKRVPQTKEEKENKITALYLDETALESPTIALASAARETLRVANIVQKMFTDSMTVLKEGNPQLLESIKKSDDSIDTLHTKIKFYLARVNEESLDPKESDRFIQILGFSTNLEHIGDIIDRSLCEIIETKIKNQHRFSGEGFKEIQNFHHNILNNMKIAQAIFMSEDPKLARQLVEGKAFVRKAAQQSSRQHFERLRDGVPETHMTSTLHTDIIRDFKRINSYLTTVAYSILDNAEKHQERRKEKTSE